MFYDTTKLAFPWFEPFYTTTSNLLDLFSKAMVTEWVSLLDIYHYDRWEVVPQLVLVSFILLWKRVIYLGTMDISFSANCPFPIYIFCLFLSNCKISGKSLPQQLFLSFPNFCHAMVLLSFVCNISKLMNLLLCTFWIFESFLEKFSPFQGWKTNLFLELYGFILFFFFVSLIDFVYLGLWCKI